MGDHTSAAETAMRQNSSVSEEPDEIDGLITDYSTQDINYGGASPSVEDRCNDTVTCGASSSNCLAKSECASLITMRTEQDDVNTLSSYFAAHDQKYPQYADKQSRLATFEDIHPSSDNTCSDRYEMFTTAGFFYEGDSGCVRCFCCGGILRAWKTADSAVLSHAWTFPDCGYIRLFISPEFVNTLQELKKNNDEMTLGQIEEHFTSQGLELPIFFRSPEDNSDIHRNAAVLAFLHQCDNEQAKLVYRAAKDLIRNGKAITIEAMLQQIGESTTTSSGKGIVTEADEDDEVIKTLKADSEKKRKCASCHRCLVMPCNVMFLPCGHINTCFDCSWACPICPQGCKIGMLLKATLAPVACHTVQPNISYQ